MTEAKRRPAYAGPAPADPAIIPEADSTNLSDRRFCVSTDWGALAKIEAKRYRKRLHVAGPRIACLDRACVGCPCGYSYELDEREEGGRQNDYDLIG